MESIGNHRVELVDHPELGKAIVLPNLPIEDLLYLLGKNDNGEDVDDDDDNISVASSYVPEATPVELLYSNVKANADSTIAVSGRVTCQK